MKLLIVGATGLIGRHVLEKALANTGIESIVAPGRRALVSHPKLFSPIGWTSASCPKRKSGGRPSRLCTLGTTIKVAGSQDAFRRVDHDYVMATARLAAQHGTPAFVLTSAIGASTDSRFFYNRVKGEVERDLAESGFTSLTFVRPGLIAESGIRTGRLKRHSGWPRRSSILFYQSV